MLFMRKFLDIIRVENISLCFSLHMRWDHLNLLEGVGARKPSESSFLQERIRGKWSEISLNVLQTDTLLMYSFILQLILTEIGNTLTKKFPKFTNRP